MNIEVTRLPESKVSLKVELTPQEVDGALDRTYKQLVQRVNIPGFRKGKAPRPVVERMVGAEYFLHEATEEAVRWGYRKAIDESDLVPIDEAEITPSEDYDHIEPGQAFSFEATVAVRPEVQLPDYHTIHVEREQVEVTDAEVQGLLDEIRERNATLEPVHRPAGAGDVVTMNVVGKVEGQEVVNRDNLDYEVYDEVPEDMRETFPGLAKALVGSAAGDIREIPIHLPADYADGDIADKTIFFRILIKDVKRKILPEADDEFAQSVSDLETIDELRARLRENLTLDRQFQADEKLAQQAMNEVVTRAFVEIPPMLVDEEIDRMIDDLTTTFERQGLSFQTYLEITKKTEPQLRAEMREDAARNVKVGLVLSAVADREGIEIPSREIDAALQEVLRESTLPEAERRRLRSSTAVRSNIRSRLRRNRAINKLVEVMSGGEEISQEAAEAVTEGAEAQDTEETVAVEIGG